ncbi:nibrin isoform X2 [Andrena cerasifolii]|uniref:nibrin isoform X2 n=1 Tax=Andrena cerasifolii TaxID=2819439 RepID=UPI004037A151
MWYLLNSAGQRIYLKPNQELTFGRKKSDVLLQNDESISRIHASIHLQPKQVAQINEPISICRVKDMGSKYGTYIIVGETERIEVQKEGYNLKHGDVVRFGLQHHTFKAVYVSIITVVSTLNDKDKGKLRDIMNEIDGLISTEWTQICTYLTVSRASLTDKVTWAMASTVPIVTLSYWEQVKRAVHNGEELPDADEFTPQISESLVIKGKVSLRRNEKRRTLFRNLLFVHFSTRQYKMCGRIIRMAGGKSLLYSKNPLTHKELCASNVIVLQCSDSDTMQSTQHVAAEYDSIYKALQDCKRQVISETDIPLAILHCSIEKYCNPKFKFGNLLKRSELKPDSSEVLVLDTQDVTADVRILPKVVSDVPMKSPVDIENAKRKIQIIPESYDTCSSSDFLDNDSISQFREGLISSTPKNSLGTVDSLNKDISVVKEAVQNVKEVCSRKTATYIPETIDSRLSDASQKDTQCSTQEGPSSREQNINTEVSEQLKESMIAEKGTPLNEVVDITVATHDELKSMYSDGNNLDANPNKIFTKDNPSKLLDVVNVRDRSPEKESRSLPEKGDVPAPRKTHNLLKLTSLETEESKTRSRKRSKNSSASQSDEECMTSARKRVCSQNLGVEDTITSSQNGTTVTTVNHSNSNDLTGFTSFFLRKKLGGKTFKKVYNMIPEKRISLEDMYVWNARNILTT